MGNIHGGCINVDALERDGSTYFGTAEPDFLTANDAWFMPVVQKTGPDGCLYILDWYDRYHCYQDANRDPGRHRPAQRPALSRPLQGHAPGRPFDLAKETDDQLIERLHSPNVYYRDLAQRLLRERNAPGTIKKLQMVVLDDKEPRKARMHALWAVVGAGPLEDSFIDALLKHRDPSYRAWGIRATGDIRELPEAAVISFRTHQIDSNRDVQLQLVIDSENSSGF